MPVNGQQTLFAVDCGATNWRLVRLEYKLVGQDAQLLGEPQPASLTSFVDRKLPAVLCLNPKGTALESFGDPAQQQFEDERNRERVRDYFKPCIGSHFDPNPQPHQKRYTHAQALQFTQMLLRALLEQLRQEKWRGGAFDERVWFSFAYPVHWRQDHDGKVFTDFEQTVRDCFEPGMERIRFVSEPEGAILSLQHRGLLSAPEDKPVTLIIDIGGSTTDIVAGQVEPGNCRLHYLGRYGEPFGGGLYDAELAKVLADELNIPASALADDPSALVTLRVFAQRVKESLSRQLMSNTTNDHVPQRTITLVMRNGTIFRRVITLDEARFRDITSSLNTSFEKLMDNALQAIPLEPGKIGQVVLVGGGAQLFTSIEHLRQRFGPERVTLADNPDEMVVQGIGLEYGQSFEKVEPTIQFSAAPVKPPVEVEEASPVTASDWALELPDERHYPLPFGVTHLGRGEANEVFIDDLKASRFHLELHVASQAIEAVDMGSTNGTYLNGQRLPAHIPHALKPGDEIAIGKTKIICRH